MVHQTSAEVNSSEDYAVCAMVAHVAGPDEGSDGDLGLGFVGLDRPTFLQRVLIKSIQEIIPF